MLTFIYNEKEQPIDIQYSPTEYDLKSFSDFERVTDLHKPVHVIKHFLSQYIKSELYKPYIEIETQYADLLRNNKKTETDENGNEMITDIIDTENITDEIKELEIKYPYLKRFRETQIYPLPNNEENIPENEQAPYFTDEDVNQYPADWDMIQLIREYNRWYYEDWVLQNGYQPAGYDFKVYATLIDIERLQTAINLAHQVAVQELAEGETLDETTVPFTIYCYDGIARDITLSDAKDILNKTWHFVDQALQDKATNRENILYANTVGDLLTVLDEIY